MLANGQTWKVLKGRYRLHTPAQSPEVDIAPGLAGRWFFKLDEDTPGPRVYRMEQAGPRRDKYFHDPLNRPPLRLDGPR